MPAKARLIGLLTAIAVLLALAPAPGLLANPGGPVIFVDFKNPPDAGRPCDFHFQTIKAALTKCPDELVDNVTIIVDSGIYNEGALTISVKGLQLQSSAGAERTKILGTLEVQAKGVLIDGFDIDVTSLAQPSNDHGIGVNNIQVQIQNNKVHGAKHAGILVQQGSDDVLISGNDLFNNGTIGVQIKDNSRNARIEKNKARSNGTAGISIEGNSDRYVITQNTISLNGSEGVTVSGTDSGEISENEIAGNGLEGIKLTDANDNTITGNTISSSGLFGISLVASDNNEVRNNQVSNNDAGGVALREGDIATQRNTVESNQILGNIKAGASGVLLEGDASGSIVLNNTIDNNSFGVRFTQSTAKHSPSNNTLVSNEITNSDQDGVSVEASAGQNVFRSNKINQNNGIGLHISGGLGNDEIAGNTFEGNGKQGILIEKSARNSLHDNTLTSNGGQGIALMGGADATKVLNNTLTSGAQEGIYLSGVSDVVISGNTVQNTRQDAIFGDKVTTLRIEDNTLSTNLERGIALSNCTTRVDVDHNTVTANAMGGIALTDCNVVDLQNDNVTNNVQYGLNATGKVDQISARRNWWGDPRGPAGVFEGTGNAVLGLTTDQVLPWLTDGPDQLIESSVTGFTMSDFGPVKIELDAMDRSNVRLELFNLAREEHGAAVLAKYQSGKPGDLLKGLTGVVKTVSVLTTGFTTGDGLVEIGYDDSELPTGVKKSDLGLFYYDRDKATWTRLTGESQYSINLVDGQISVTLLRQGAIITLATGKATP